MGRGTGLTRPGRRDFLVLAAAAVAAPQLRAQVEALKPSQSSAFPAFSALDLEGRSMKVPAPGRPAIVNFWATWCPPCRAEMPLLQQLTELYGDKFQLQLVNFKERPATIQRYMRESAWNMPVLLDPLGEGAAAWGVKRYPTTVGFDVQGKARWRMVGELDWSTAEAGKLVESLWR
jgi:thiol-disulfide isomerase/thioredoxin